MARPRRIQYPGARYHVINRGNYRQPIFASSGAAAAFEAVLIEACTRYRWQLHAHAVMRNHFHLALETPEPNLVEGMHWLLGTFANRFNRFRDERGHLFQGRYTAKPVGDDAHLARLIHYIHLNPVHAGIVPVAQVAAFRWGSLRRLMRCPRPAWLKATALLDHLGLADSHAGWSRYLDLLAGLAAQPTNDGNEFDPWVEGWAIGSPQWETDFAGRHVVLAAGRDIRAADLRPIKEARWQQVLTDALAASGKSTLDIIRDPQRRRVENRDRPPAPPRRPSAPPLDCRRPSYGIALLHARLSGPSIWPGKLTSSGLTPCKSTANL